MPVRSTSAGRKFAGGSGRIASAGGSFAARRTALKTPSSAAPTPDSERQHHRRAIEPEIQVRKAKEEVVHLYEPMAQRHAAQRADRRSAHHHHERKLQVVQDDLPVRKTKRFEDGDLLALESQQPRQHRVGHERRDAQEHDRETDGERLQDANFVRDPDVRGMIRPAIGPASAVGFEQAVQLRDHRSAVARRARG